MIPSRKKYPLELLAPAKNLECGIAAINYGADAVYIGAPKFGARANAGNTIGDIERLAAYAHKYWARVYVALNTLIYDNELEEVNALLRKIYNAGADAVIIQDMGILQMELPPLPLFASTQTHNYSLERIKFLGSVGFQRIILARELSLLQIQEISSVTDVELEFFVHGALCVSYSGQCYISHAVTGRSANRGQCAQCCRLPYSLLDNTGKVIMRDKHLLSLKDLNLSARLDDLIEAGITSFKIEGRLKDIDYVKNITAFYRMKLDEILSADPVRKKASSGKTVFEFIPDPEKSFNRDFTEYMIDGKAGSIASPLTPKSIGKKIGKVLTVGSNSLTIDSKVPLIPGDGLCFINSSGKLEGLSVNRVDGSKIFANEIKNLREGDLLYRNNDLAFENLLKSDKSQRKINVDLEIFFCPEEIIIAALDEDRNYVRENFLWEPIPAKNPDRCVEQFRTQFRKTGNSIFTVKEIVVNPFNVYFLPLSKINLMRRKVFDSLLASRLKRMPLLEIPYPTQHEAYPEQKLAYNGNVVNHLARNFYFEHGVREIEEGFELKSEFSNSILMTTKHCIKRELGVCPVDNPENANKYNEPLYLSDFSRKYRLVFNCADCEMMVLQGKST